MKSKATASWQGKGSDGIGRITAKSGAFKDAAYSYRSRFEGGVPGTNPEELLASAHAACFAMKLAFTFEAEGYVPDDLQTECEITMEAGVITSANLSLKAKVPRITKQKFEELVDTSGKNCPVSKLFNAEINIKAELL